MNAYTEDFLVKATEVWSAPEQFGFSNITDACITPYVRKGAFCKGRSEFF